MAMKAMSVVGLDVHARRTLAAVLVCDAGGVRVSVLRMAPVGVVGFLGGVGAVRAVDEAGPAGFGLARAARERGIDVRVAAPGSIPRGPGDRVKTDRRDAIRRARLLAAGELGFALVPSVEDECLRDLVRADRGCARRSDARASPAGEGAAAPWRALPGHGLDGRASEVAARAGAR